MYEYEGIELWRKGYRDQDNHDDTLHWTVSALATDCLVYWFGLGGGLFDKKLWRGI